jgi:RNA polymerase sigma factor (sigma-70 family)
MIVSRAAAGSDEVANAPEKRKQGQRAAVPVPIDSSRAYQSDPEIVQACLDGDQAAWDALVERYGRLVYSIPFRWGLSKADADDVFQNVFTIVYRRLHNLRNQTSLAAWLITITSRECWRLSHHVEFHAELDEAIADAELLPADRAEHSELNQVVHTAISRLDQRSQDLLKSLFFEIDPPSYEKIAAHLGLAVGSIGSARARALKKLEAILIDMGIGSSW